MEEKEGSVWSIFTDKTETIKEASVHRGLFYPVELIVFIALYLLNMMLLIPLAARPFLRIIDLKSTSQKMLLSLFITIILAVFFILYPIFVQKRPMSGIGFTTTRVNPFREYGKGLLYGFLMISAAILANVAIGGTHFIGFGGVSVLPYVLLCLFGFMIQGMEEEIVTRGFFMVSICRRYPAWLGILSNSLLFGLMHLLNPGVTFISTLNTILAGILFSLIFLKRDSIWMVSAIHTAWNFSQSNIYGQSTSGLDLIPSLFKMDAPTGYNWVNGGSYGVEASIITTTFFSVLILYLIFKKRNKLSYPLA